MGTSRTRRFGLFALSCCCILISMGLASAWAGEGLQRQEPAEPWAFREGRVEIGVQAGGGVSLQDEPHDGTVITLRPRVGYILHEVKHGLPGSPEIAAQPTYQAVFQDGTSHVWGLAALAKYTIRTETRITPFVELGGGVAFATQRTPSLGSNFNFILQAGIGLNYAIDDRYALTFQWLYQHMSNSGIYPSNPGLNMAIFLLGISWLR